MIYFSLNKGQRGILHFLLSISELLSNISDISDLEIAYGVLDGEIAF